MEGCLFCGISQGQIPSFKVYEDDQFYASLDINPANPGHLIVFPKAHYKTVMEMSEPEYYKLFSVVRALSLTLFEYGALGVNLLYAMGEAAGQRSPHLIVHIIPRYKEDQVNLIWQPQKYTQEQFTQIQQKIIEKIHGVQQPQPQQPQQIPQPQPSRLLQPPSPQQPLFQPNQVPSQEQIIPTQEPEEQEKIYELKRKSAGYW